MSKSTQNKIIERLTLDLLSPDETVVLKALEQCRQEGTAGLIEPLIGLYASTSFTEVKGEVADMLQSLKIGNAEEPFMQALKNPAYRYVRKDLLSFMWNSALEPTGWLADITKIALEGDLQEVLECVTLIESMEDLFPEEQVLESIQLVREFLNGAPLSDKSKMLAVYLHRLEHLEQD